MNLNIEQQTIKKLAWRLIPLMLICYLINYLDRVNVGFAALEMNQDIGISASVFGWGAGLFFISYCLFEVPSNLALHRYGARRWIARIMISWGIVSTCFAFVEGPISFMIMRFLLGVAEAGFFPGMILYVSYWFPPKYRGKLTALFMTAIPLSALLGAPLSGWILQAVHYGELKSWQWLFILEGVPAVFLGVVVFFYLTDKPENAKWLTPEQRTWLMSQLSSEKKSSHLSSLRDAVKSVDVMLLAIVHMGFAVGSYGISFWLPQILKEYALSNQAIGLLSAIPYIVATFGMVIWGGYSDQSGSRARHVAAGCLLGAVGLLAAIVFPSIEGVLIGISLSTLGVVAARPIFWTIPGSFLTGTAAAGGIALINALGNLGGFVGPYAIGAVKQSTGSYGLGLAAIAVPLLVSVVAILYLGWRLKQRAHLLQEPLAGSAEKR